MLKLPEGINTVYVTGPNGMTFTLTREEWEEAEELHAVFQNFLAREIEGLNL